MFYFNSNFFFSDRLRPKINQIEDQNIKDYMIIRYLNLVKRLEIHTLKTAFFYYILSLNVTFGSLLMPPLLSIKNEENDYFWSILIISLIVSGSNAIIKLFHLDKFYVTRHIRMNQFKTEGLFFLTGVSPYGEINEENFRLFVKNIEKLKREHILEEYTQNREENNNRRDEQLEDLTII
jgi:hypothetical protein